MPRFRAELRLEGKTATYVVVPLDVPAVFGRARPPVDAETRAAVDRMSHTHRKEYVDWITEAKSEETRRRRIAKAGELIRQGKPRR